MSYQNYIIAAYAVFAIVLGWDYVATRLQIRRELNNARRRAARQASQASRHPAPSDPAQKTPDELTR